MSGFAFDELGFWPTYPGHPCTLALLILRKYPEEAKVVPLLREALAKVAPIGSAAAHSG